MSARAEEARDLQRGGFTIPEICERMGVKRAWVYTLLKYEEYREVRLAQLSANRRRRGQGMNECSVCGGLGHNSRRHK